MDSNVNILVVDDERGIRDLLARELGLHGYQVATAQNGEEAVLRLKEASFQLIISDVKMPKMGGLEFLKAAKRLSPDAEVILATAYGTIETAVTAMKDEAYDFIQKPFHLDELMGLVTKALEKTQLKATAALYQASKTAFGTVKLEASLPRIVDLARRLLKSDTASIVLANEGRLELAASFGLDSEEQKRLRLEIAGRVAAEEASRWESLNVADSLADDPRFAGIPGLEGIQAKLVKPLAVNGVLLGVLMAGRTSAPEPFSPSDIRHFSILASQAAQAIHNAKLCRRLEETQNQLTHSEKINEIGRLAAGVAHEINNPLSCILGTAQLALEAEGLSAEHRDDLNCIIEETQRCGHIVADILQFSRKAEPEKVPVSLVPLLESALRLSKFGMPRGVEIIREWPETSPCVLADPMQLKQVFLNIIRNAGQALETSPVKKLVLRVETSASATRIQFQDSGRGIPPEHLDKLFKPFFTTKPEGQGTGLGLSVCRDIVERHGGAIRAASVRPGGTTFTIELPAAAEETA